MSENKKEDLSPPVGVLIVIGILSIAFGTCFGVSAMIFVSGLIR